MNVRDPHDLRRIAKKDHLKRKRRYVWRFAVVLVVLVVAGMFGGYTSYSRALSPLTAREVFTSLPAGQVQIDWPKNAEAAIGTVDQGVLATSPNQYKSPTASVTKLMVALMVLEKHPLKPGEQGPTITITQHDADLYHQYVAVNGSVAPVNVGERISEYQALEAMLLPSANNIADTLAVWAYGSMDAYHAEANIMAQKLSMDTTHFGGDASGFSPKTISTPHDLVLLGQAAMKNPVIKEIVAKPSAKIPVAGTIHNVNWLLGQHDVIGIKTGNTDQAGGCYLFAATHTLPDGKQTIVIGAIMDAPNLHAAISAAPSLLASVYPNFTSRQVVIASQVVARYSVPWLDDKVNVLAQKDISIVGWKGLPVTATVRTEQLTPPAQKDVPVGIITVTSGNTKASSSLYLAQGIDTPHWLWRLTHY